jgi:hypothetical protein
VKHQIHYLNTDLDLVSDRDLHPLVSALPARGMLSLAVFQRADSHWQAALEADEVFHQPDAHIAAILAAVEGLAPEAGLNWSGCSVRELNIGYDCGDEPWAFTNSLAAATLARIAALGASLRITLYPQRNHPE